MHELRFVAICCIAGGIMAVTAPSSEAQHSSGGTAPSVTEGKSGASGQPQSGQSGHEGQSQSGRHADEGQSGMMSGQSTTGSGSRDVGSVSGTGEKPGMGSSHGSRTASRENLQRSGGSQGTQEEMYEDRMRDFQESQPTQGTKKP